MICLLYDWIRYGFCLKDTTDRHNDNLITDLDDVSLLCDNEVEEATGNHQVELSQLLLRCERPRS